MPLAAICYELGLRQSSYWVLVQKTSAGRPPADAAAPSTADDSSDNEPAAACSTPPPQAQSFKLRPQQKQESPPAPEVATEKRQRTEAKRKSGDIKERKTKRAKQAEPQPADAQTAPPAASAHAARPAEPIFGKHWAALEATTIATKDGEAVTTFRSTPAASWWGAKQFVSAGQLNGLERKQATSERKEFSEQDQTSLYMQLHDAKTSGKGGLGKNSAPAPGLAHPG